MRSIRCTVPLQVRGWLVNVAVRCHYDGPELEIDEYTPQTEDAGLYDEARDLLTAADVEAVIGEE
jgi:hypothetical protein